MGFLLNVTKTGISGFTFAREEVAFYMFIFEEAVQTLGMSCYLLTNAGQYQEAAEVAQYMLDEYVNPMIAFCDPSVGGEELAIGILAWPMNTAFLAFFMATKKNLEYYIQQAYIPV